MPRNDPRGTLPFPTRGIPGGWVDAWDEPLDHALLREAAIAAEQRLNAMTARLGPAWRAEQDVERQQRKREQNRRSRQARRQTSRR